MSLACASGTTLNTAVLFPLRVGERFSAMHRNQIVRRSRPDMPVVSPHYGLVILMFGVEILRFNVIRWRNTTSV